jgi:hypothetical protein
MNLAVKMWLSIAEQNVRDGVLTPEKFQRMLGILPDYLKAVLLRACYTGMCGAHGRPDRP